MMICPECGTKISEKASSCPYCGYRTNVRNLPIKVDNNLAKVQWDEGVFSPEFYEIMPISNNQNSKLSEIFCNANTLQQVSPALFEAVKAMIPKTVKVAELMPEAQKLLDSGVLHFKLDKNGEILPSVYNTITGKIGAQVRLKELNLTPAMGPAIINLQTQVALAEIISEIHDVQKEIANLHKELQDDRLALVDSAWQQLRQASLVEDTRLRNQMLLSISQEATNAKCKMIRAFERDKLYLESKSDRGFISILLDKEGQENASNKSCELFTNLLAITKAVQIETTAYCVLDEPGAAKVCLTQFKDFINANNLSDQQTLLEFNSYSNVSHKSLISAFSDIDLRIEELISTNKKDLLCE